MIDPRDAATTADERGELFGVHMPELQLEPDDYRAGLRAAHLGPGEQYLELGSGHGRGLVIAVKEFAAQAQGVEYLEDAYERSEEAARNLGIEDRVRLVRDDLRQFAPTHLV